MKISEAWLREFVTPSGGTRELVRRLTMAGLKIESVEPVAGAFSGVVVATVRAVKPHPDAAKLSVCRVWDGAAEHQVVCGAPNVAAGMQVAFARPGAELPGGVRIARSTLRGVESNGMLCSAAELGIGDGADGILELHGDYRPGDSLRDALELDDVAIDIELTPNRGDCLSVRGIARETGVLFQTDVIPADCAPVAAVSAATFPVRVEDPAACPRYLGRVIRGIDLDVATPTWMCERLRRAGLRSIDPVVDVTNYVMLELGQPLHAFDLAVLQKEIVVRKARAGETLLLLDGKEVTLDRNTLLITDASGPIAMAGVMGGDRSGIGAMTTDVFVECAFFSVAAIAGTGRRYGLQTDASQRYERGVDHGLQFAAMERVTALLLAIVGGVPGPVVDVASTAQLPRQRTVTLRRSRLDLYVGETIAVDEIADTFARLEFQPQRERGDDVVWSISVPSHRFDIEREVDLVEEVCRVRGYDRIPVRMPLARIELGRIPIDVTPRSALKRLLADLGYQEAVTYSFIDPTLADLLDPGAPAITLTNPMSQDMSVMRTTLFPGLLKTLLANVSRQQTRVRLFELGRCFHGGDAKSVELTQPFLLGGLLWGSRLPESWTNDSAGLDFFDLKGDVERVLEYSGHRSVRYEPLQDPVLHPGQSASIWSNDVKLGRLGRLHPELEHRLELKSGVFLFELDATQVGARSPRAHEAISRYPSVRRDLSLELGIDVAAATVRACVERVLGSTLKDFTLFDVYQGEGIDSNKKSIAIGLTLQDHSRTLTDTDINTGMEAVVSALERDLGARRR
jgi:phenylalanyl-tRNA synthetase beta chain